jgi:hypothetical protein
MGILKKRRKKRPEPVSTSAYVIPTAHAQNDTSHTPTSTIAKASPISSTYATPYQKKKSISWQKKITRRFLGKK